MSEVLRVYVAGPMTGIPRFNFPAFDAARVELERAGYSVVSPADLDDPAARAAAMLSPDGKLDDAIGQTWGDFLSRDVKLVADVADAVVVLPGWEGSRGARLEVFTARLCEKAVYDYAAWCAARLVGDVSLSDFPVRHVVCA